MRQQLPAMMTSHWVSTRILNCQWRGENHRSRLGWKSVMDRQCVLGCVCLYRCFWVAIFRFNGLCRGRSSAIMGLGLTFLRARATFSFEITAEGMPWEVCIFTKGAYPSSFSSWWTLRSVSSSMVVCNPCAISWEWDELYGSARACLWWCRSLSLLPLGRWCWGRRT